MPSVERKPSATRDTGVAPHKYAVIRPIASSSPSFQVKKDIRGLLHDMVQR